MWEEQSEKYAKSNSKPHTIERRSRTRRRGQREVRFSFDSFCRLHSHTLRYTMVLAMVPTGTRTQKYAIRNCTHCKLSGMVRRPMHPTNHYVFGIRLCVVQHCPLCRRKCIAADQNHATTHLSLLFLFFIFFPLHRFAGAPNAPLYGMPPIRIANVCSSNQHISIHNIVFYKIEIGTVAVQRAHTTQSPVLWRLHFYYYIVYSHLY